MVIQDDAVRTEIVFSSAAVEGQELKPYEITPTQNTDFGISPLRLCLPFQSTITIQP